MQVNHMGLGRGTGHSISYLVKWLGWFLAGFGLSPLCTVCPLRAVARGADCQMCSRVQAWCLLVARHQQYPFEGTPPHCVGCTTSVSWLASGCACPGAVRNWGAAGWEIPRVATGARFHLSSTAPLLPQEPPVEAALDAYQIVKGKKGFHI